jgi:hypothetical protein
MKTQLIMAVIVLGATIHAQPERAATYKCVTDGKVTYTDAPCVGGKLVDTTPTQGFGRMSSPSRKGTGTRKSRRPKPAAEVPNPFLDPAEEESTQAVNRPNLASPDKRDGQILDGNETRKQKRP